jgi:cytoskeletal protein CcmA (bactofilin family)
MWSKQASDPGPQHSGIREGEAGAKDARDVPVIGRTLVVRGQITGQESLVIRGRVHGDVILPDNNVFVDPEGRVEGNIHALTIRVEGRVSGVLRGDQRILIRASAEVDGDIVSPRITLEEGCRYRGRVDTAARGSDLASVDNSVTQYRQRDGS